MYLLSLRDRPEKVTKGYLFYLFRKLAQMNFCFPRKCNSNNRIICGTRSSYDLLCDHTEKDVNITIQK